VTIREYIERRATVVALVIVLALLVFPDAIAMFSTFGMLVGLVPILALYYAIGGWTNCPRCKGSLSKTLTEAVFLTNVPDKCPPLRCEFRCADVPGRSHSAVFLSRWIASNLPSSGRHFLALDLPK
jgi:hypothetical protein